MKIKNLLMVILLMAVPLHTLSMDEPEPEIPSASAFKNLPLELKEEIFLTIASSPEAYSIDHALKRMDWTASDWGIYKELNKLLSNKVFCLRLIKTLSAWFKRSNMTVLRDLLNFGNHYWEKSSQIKEGRKTLQQLGNNYEELFTMCDDPMHLLYNWKWQLQDLLKREIDLEFTKGYDLSDNERILLNPLKTALFHLNIPVAQYLIEHKADVNSQDIIAKNTPLIICLRRYPQLATDDKIKMKDLIKRLLSNRADPELANGDKQTPLMLAKNTGDQNLIKLIDDAIAKKPGTQ